MLLEPSLQKTTPTARKPTNGSGYLRSPLSSSDLRHHLPRRLRETILLRKLPRLLALLALLAVPGVSLAQDVEPRRWTHLPVGLDVVGAAYVYTNGDLFFDPVLRIEDAEIDQQTALGIYTRVFGLAGRTARLDLLVPVKWTRWQGLLDGAFRTARREGLADPILRLSMNLVGAPALKGKEFQEYRAANTTATVLGVGLAVVLPLGEYEEDKLLNLGGNRVVAKPEIGVVHTRGPWSYELTASVSLFEDNDEFWNGNKLEQDPLFAAQAHVVRVFRRGLWLSLSAAYSQNGESEVNDVPKDDPRDQILSALTFGFPVARDQGLKFAYIRGRMLEDVGTDTDNFAVAWTKQF